MQVLPALEVKSRFGRVSNIVKGGELVTITQHGEPTMVLFPLKLAEEVLKAYRTLGKPNSKQADGEGLLEWLEERALKAGQHRSLGIPHPHECHLGHEPNKETEEYLLLPDSKKGYKNFSNLDDLFADLKK